MLASTAALGLAGKRASAAGPARPVDGHYDIIVCGGGPGGVCAAVAAARAGKKVLLIEQYGFLGGMATAGLVEPYMPYRTGEIVTNAGIFEEVCRRLSDSGAFGSELHASAFDTEVLKMVELDLCLAAGVEILFHSFVFRTTVRRKRITEVHVANKAGEMSFSAELFVDATGDGDLAFHAGADWELGREQDGLTQPSTLFFKMANVDLKKALKYVDSGKDDRSFKKLTEKARAAGEFTSPREDTLWFCTPRQGVIAFNTTRLVKFNATDPWDLTRMEIEGLKQVRDTGAFANKYLPGFGKAYISQVASNVGVRESRRVVGDYQITQDDLLSCRPFDDSVARGCYPIDIHSPTGGGTTIIHLEEGQSYAIPYRSLLVKGFDNLIMGCRAIWGTHEAHSAYRVQPIVMSIGHAAGVAAAMASSSGADYRRVSVPGLQERLRAQGAVV
ncbi:MAG: FAD-dependent oxidoreductase [Candidatus Glassbacteria bacterium]|nr:FAD-dependent oxidoreductase [Candidatus Glassbacteria bacterium]